MLERFGENNIKIGFLFLNNDKVYRQLNDAILCPMNEVNNRCDYIF